MPGHDENAANNHDGLFYHLYDFALSRLSREGAYDFTGGTWRHLLSNHVAQAARQPEGLQTFVRTVALNGLRHLLSKAVQLSMLQDRMTDSEFSSMADVLGQPEIERLLLLRLGGSLPAETLVLIGTIILIPSESSRLLLFNTLRSATRLFIEDTAGAIRSYRHATIKNKSMQKLRGPLARFLDHSIVTRFLEEYDRGAVPLYRDTLSYVEVTHRWIQGTHPYVVNAAAGEIVWDLVVCVSVSDSLTRRGFSAAEINNIAALIIGDDRVAARALLCLPNKFYDVVPPLDRKDPEYERNACVLVKSFCGRIARNPKEDVHVWAFSSMTAVTSFINYCGDTYRKVMRGTGDF